MFTQPDGRRISAWAFRKVWLPIRARLDMDWLHFHDLRHVTASLMAKGGVPDAVRQDVMRHATEKMTRLYTQTDLAQHRQAVTTVEGLLGL